MEFENFPSATVCAVKKNKVGGKLHLPLILRPWVGGKSWGEIAFTPIDWIGGFRIKDVRVETDCICRQDKGLRLDGAESVHMYIDWIIYYKTYARTNENSLWKIIS